MRDLDRQARLMADILRRFSEAELRAALRRELPELLAELPGPGVPFRDVVFMLVQAAQKCGYEPDLEILIASRRRPSVGLRAVIVVGVLVLMGAGGAFLTGWAIWQRPSASEAIGEATPPARVEPPPTSPVDAPEARPAAEPLSADSRPHAERRKESSQGERKREAPVPASPPPEPASEPTAGRAECRGWSCRLSADSGQFHKSEEFCVVPAAGTGVKRCIIHGELIHPAPTVECDLSESQLTGEVRWRRCHGEN
jgi:hypothetical protein